jgi:UV DNA damage endonuclease
MTGLNNSPVAHGSRQTRSSPNHGNQQDETPTKKKRQPTKSSLAAKKGSDELKAFRASQAASALAAKQENDDATAPIDPEAGGAITEDIETVKLEAARPPPVNSAYLPLPWKGRLGYACLNTYLRTSDPPIFSSRTCRIASILSHRHPLHDPSRPEHRTTNRPDRDAAPDVALGQRYVQDLGLANARDIATMLRWNERFGIRFLRLSSEMFPFASHEVHGYRLAPFAADVLAEAGRVAAQLGHRLSVHPGQFTQLGSPRRQVIEGAVRDLEYHDEMLSLLRLPEQMDRDAVIVLHLGGTYGDKAATVDRFRANYQGLSASIKRRLVLENDDVAWSVHDLLPLCEELDIPLVLDFHHHNIVFDGRSVREGTRDVVDLFPRIARTWQRKRMTQKMHYSEACADAVTGRQRRKHSARVKTLPPCADDMDLMIEAKDKEQAVFELMRTFRLPGWDGFNDVIPYERTDDNRAVQRKTRRKKTKKQVAAEIEEFGEEVPESPEVEREEVGEGEIGMGGPEKRVYWPPGMEDWLRPKKRDGKKKDVGVADMDDVSTPTASNVAAGRELGIRERKPMDEALKERIRNAQSINDVQAILDEVKERNRADVLALAQVQPKKERGRGNGNGKKGKVRAKKEKKESTPSDAAESEDLTMEEFEDKDVSSGTLDVAEEKKPVRRSGRVRAGKVDYADNGADEEMES